MIALPRLILRIGQSNVLAALATIATGILTARWLGPSGRGEYALFVTTVGIAGTIGNMGFYQASIFNISKASLSPSKAMGSIILLMLLNVAALAMVCWVVFLVFGFHLPVFDGIGMGLALVLACLCTVAQESLGGIAMATKRYAIYTDQLLLDPLLVLCFTLALTLVSRNERTAVWLRVAGSSVAIAVMLWRVLHLKIARTINIQAFWQQVRFGSRTVAQNLFGLLNYRVYLYFLASDTSAAGHFSVALLFCELVRFVPNAVGTALLPFLAEGIPEESARLASLSCRHLLAFGVMTVAFFVPLRESIVRNVFGATFLPIVAPTLVMLIGALVGTIYQIFTRYFTSIGKQSISVACAAAGLAAGSLLSLLLIPQYGLMGAAFAYLAGSLASSITIAYGFHRLSAERFSDFLLVKRSDLDLWVHALRRTRPES